MSKKNILETNKLPNGRVQVTFDAADGKRVYEYGPIAAKQIAKGRDPVDFTGRLVKHEKPK
jgi:hypothetical protein